MYFFFLPLTENELAFHFETNDAVAPTQLGVFLAELERIARLKQHFGPDAQVRVTELGTGSVWGKIAVGLGALGGAATIASFGLNISDRLTQPHGKLAEAVAAMSIDSSVVSATIVTNEKTITVTSNDMPAIATVKEKRKHARYNQTDTSNRIGFDDSLVLSSPTERPDSIPKGRRNFSNLGDPRGARNYVGEFRESDGEEYEIFRQENGHSFAAKVSNEYPLPIVYRTRVMVRAELDKQNHLMFVHEIYPLEAT